MKPKIQKFVELKENARSTITSGFMQLEKKTQNGGWLAPHQNAVLNDSNSVNPSIYLKQP